MKKLRFSLTFIVCSLCVVMAASAAGISGTPSSWAKNEIAEARTLKLIPNFSGSPSYSSPITRQQFAQLVVQMLETAASLPLTPTEWHPFSDCADPAVETAAYCYIVSGTGDGTFNPAGLLTREQLSVMMYRGIASYCAFLNKTLPIDGIDFTSWSDSTDVSAWAKLALSRMVKADMVKGSDGRLNPSGSCTIEQAILIANRAYKTMTTLPDFDMTKTMYSDFPNIPEYGVWFGIKHDDELLDATLGGGKAYQYAYMYDDPMISSYFTYIYLQYDTAVAELGFAPNFTGRHDAPVPYLSWRNTKDPSQIIYAILYKDAHVVQATDKYKNSSSVQTLYANSHDVPDFGAIMGVNASVRRTEDGSMYIGYPVDAEHNNIGPYVEVLFTSGYVYDTTTIKDDIKLNYFIHKDTKEKIGLATTTLDDGIGYVTITYLIK